MQRRGSAFNGFAIEASDGFAGRIVDLLFEDTTWIVRWFVVDITTWASARQVLLHPAALERPDNLNRAFPVQMTKLQVKESPGIQTDEPVSQQMERGDSYDPAWGGSFYDGAIVGAPTTGWMNNNGMITHAAAASGDAHLRSLNAVTGYHIRALDGEVGHLKDVLLDDETWTLDCVLIDTKNWWRGKDVLLPAAAIKQIDWAGEYVRVDQTRYDIKACQPWTQPDWSS